MISEAPPVVDERRLIYPAERVTGVQPDLDSDLDDLMFAAAHGRIITVKLLLESGADVNARSKMYDSTALGIAVTNRQINVIQALVDKGADVNGRCIRGQTALAYAAGTGDLDLVTALLEAGADVNIKDATGATPLMWAVGAGHVAVVRALLGAGADANARDSNGYTAFSLVPPKRLFSLPFLGEFYSNRRDEELIQLLKSHSDAK